MRVLNDATGVYREKGGVSLAKRGLLMSACMVGFPYTYLRRYDQRVGASVYGDLDGFHNDLEQHRRGEGRRSARSSIARAISTGIVVPRTRWTTWRTFM